MVTYGDKWVGRKGATRESGVSGQKKQSGRPPNLTLNSSDVRGADSDQGADLAPAAHLLRGAHGKPQPDLRAPLNQVASGTLCHGNDDALPNHFV